MILNDWMHSYSLSVALSRAREAATNPRRLQFSPLSRTFRLTPKKSWFGGKRRVTEKEQKKFPLNLPILSPDGRTIKNDLKDFPWRLWGTGSLLEDWSYGGKFYRGYRDRGSQGNLKLSLSNSATLLQSVYSWIEMPLFRCRLVAFRCNGGTTRRDTEPWCPATATRAFPLCQSLAGSRVVLLDDCWTSILCKSHRLP